MNKNSMSINRRYIACYEKLAEDDLKDPFDKDKEERHKMLRNFIGETSSYVVLDIGASQGLFLDSIKSKYKVAFDISFNYLAVAKNKNLNCVLGNAEILPFKEESFDLIICSDILEHVLDPENVINESRNVLKTGGKLFIVVPWKEDLTPYEIYKGIYEFTHLRTFDNGAIFSLLSNWKINKMKGVIAKTILLPKNLRKIPGLNKIVNFIIPNWIRLNYYPGPVHMMIEAEKIK